MTIASDITVIVPARSGSTRLPGKNVAPLSFAPDHTMLTWKLHQLKQVFPTEQIVVSSDSVAYLHLAREAGVGVHHRSDYLASSTVPFSEVVTALAQVVRTEYFGWAPPTSPLFGPRHIRGMVETFAHISDVQRTAGLGTVERLVGYFGYDGRWLNFTPGRSHRNSQDLVSPVRVTWGLSLRRTSEVMATEALFQSLDPAFIVPSWAGIDVDDDLDLRTAELLWPLYQQFEQNSAEV
ncbi:cytidylyltransferase domain-containing protein [Actinotalea subterranea]|uniref:cytidylyltransferase domain-containing protein n=1 Tax=Actinotalea subterranea TaxID=2607497 RepID=UPI0011EE46CA|nr:hypothetical protein [Actinotalea subterranea]